MKQIFLSLLILLATGNLLQAQDRVITRGATPGELYIKTPWYKIGTIFDDSLYLAIYHLTENGKKLTIQYNMDYMNTPHPQSLDSLLIPSLILADATPGVLYNKCFLNNTSLWVSFDYGKNFVLREVNIGNHHYFMSNQKGTIYRIRPTFEDSTFMSNDYGINFTMVKDTYIIADEMGLDSCEFFSITSTPMYGRYLTHTYDTYQTYIEIPIDSQYVYGAPDIYRGGFPGEVYVSSEFNDTGRKYKISFSADTGHTFRHVYVSESYDPLFTSTPGFMSDREPGVFYIVRAYRLPDVNPSGWHTKLCIEYYRDYGEILEAVFCHDLNKDYEYKEVICVHTTNLNAKVANNSIQLQWLNSAEDIRGYHVFRNNVRITNTMLTEATYLDENLPVGNYEYYVKTYYKEGCGSDSSNHVREAVEVGMEELRIENGELRIYPNPTNGELRIENGELKIENIEIFDVYGRKIFNFQLSTFNSIDVSGLQAGIYFVRIATERGVVMRKVVKY